MPQNSRSNLVPTRVTDKNGKTTTVYRRAEASGSSTASIPKPMVAKERRESFRAKKERLGRRINRISSSTTDNLPRILAAMNTYSPLMVDKIDELMEGFNSASDIAELVFRGCNEAEINECLLFTKDLGEMDYFHSVKLVRTTHHGLYKGLPEEDDYSLADDEVKSKVSSLMKITGAIYSNHSYWSPYLEEKMPEGIGHIAIIKDERLISLALERHEDADVIAALIRERKTADFDVISELISGGSGGAKPLMSGLL